MLLHLSRKRLLVVVAAAVAVANSASSASADLFAYEGFDYDAGSGVVGQTGGDGWSTAWAASTANPQVQSPGATYPLLPTVGNKAFISATNQTERTLSAGVQGEGDETIWVSFIGQRVGDNSIRFFGLTFYEGSTGTTANERFSIGEGSNSSSDLWGARFTSTGAGVVESSVSVNTESLLLLRLDYHSGADDDLFLWVNPDLSLGEPGSGTADASSIGNFNLAFDRVSMRAGTSSGGNIGEAFYDEIRIGTTFASVIGPGLVAGDVNGDLVVDINDYVIIRDNLHLTGAVRSQGDLNGDEVVNLLDFRFWKNNRTDLGAGAGAQTALGSVPEPSTLALVLLGMLAFASRKFCRR